MTREEAFLEINNTQDEYIDQLVTLMSDPNYASMKAISFTSPTGTGKTKMMSKLINRMPDCYFIITTLSKGQLHMQIRANLAKDCCQNNFDVYGTSDYKINSKLQADDIISKIPFGSKCIWLRDEGHIKTNRFDALLFDHCYKVINFSATNIHGDIICNFAHTMMLRTVNQTSGTPEDAIEKLLEVKKEHRFVPNYNPCAIFRCVGGDEELHKRIVDLCLTNDLKYIDITDESFIMSELCKDDNEYDVIINKFKIVEGIDIRRAHVLYMDNQPANSATTIQVIGRCRRNALLYRDDIDILAPENHDLLLSTRECFVFYNVEHMLIDTDTDGELQYAFCNYISCEKLKVGSIIDVINGQMMNGLYLIELMVSDPLNANEVGLTGKFEVQQGMETGFNILNPLSSYYSTYCHPFNDYIYLSSTQRINISNVIYYPIKTTETIFDYSIGANREIECEPYYDLSSKPSHFYLLDYDDDVIFAFNDIEQKTIEDLRSCGIVDKCIDQIVNNYPYENYSELFEDSLYEINEYIENYLSKNENSYEAAYICQLIKNLDNYVFWYENEPHRLGDYLDYDEVSYIKFLIIYSLTNYDSHIFIQNKIEELAKILFELNSYDFDLDLIDIRVLIIYVFNAEKESVLTMNDLKQTMQNDFFNCCEIKDGKLYVSLESIENFYQSMTKTIKDTKCILLDSQIVFQQISMFLDNIRTGLNRKSIHCFSKDNKEYIETVPEDQIVISSRFAKPGNNKINKRWYDQLPKYISYVKIYNDIESAIIGTDWMQQIRASNEIIWTENKAISSKVCGYNKLNAFISKKYDVELSQAKQQYFSGKNNFKMNKKCNSIIGYCVEYYSKYLLYGEAFLDPYIEKAQLESHTQIINDCIIIRACMLKYKEMMMSCFGNTMAKIIKGISVQELIKDDYRYFVSLVVELGTRTAKFVKATLYKNGFVANNVDPNLSVLHISGLADYITEDTILDVKVQNHIDEKMIRQVLGYHYLSTKRTDLHITKLIVYDATSDKAVAIDISEKNMISNVILPDSSESTNSLMKFKRSEKRNLETTKTSSEEIQIYNSNITLTGKARNNEQVLDESKEQSVSFINKFVVNEVVDDPIEEKPMVSNETLENTNASNTKRLCKVICIETGMVFDNHYEAAKFFNWTSLPLISECCKDLTKTAAGYHWAQYIEELNGNRKVLCLETGVIYKNAYDAACLVGWVESPTISECCKDLSKIAAGCHWCEYMD